ncbi:ATP-binding cassette domain-containing protein [Williamsia maris]|uniref:ABC transport system ATP-binding protein n=1 Tax=Williamsia maris TaxID=72806 RepID=A0ABT1HDU1_9NOCA|nr:ABC transporter ATP-binding protein [Williamsia maris]MCP2176425.1 putative ABC transport system ATP-binding protein [Williamsia maris]
MTGGWVLRRTITRNTRWLVGGSVLIAGYQLCEVAIPILIGVIVDRAVSSGSYVSIAVWTAVLAAVFVVLTVLYRLGARQLMFGIARESHLLRDELSGRALEPGGLAVAAGRDDAWSSGELLSISTTDADNTSYVIDYIPRVVSAVVGTVACGVVLLTIDLVLGAMVLVGIPIVVLGLQVTAPLIARRVEAQQDTVGRTSGLATDLVSGLRPLQGIGATGAASDRYRRSSRTSLAAALRAARIQSVHAGASAAVGALAAMGVAVAAVYFALTGDMGIGALITVIGLAQFLIDPFALLAIVPSWVAEARASADRVAAVLGAPLLRGASEKRSVAGSDRAPAGPRGAVRIDCSAHGGLTDLVLDIAPGEYVAVLAPSARDAAALVELLAGDPTAPAGSVSVDGRRIEDIPAGTRRHAIVVEHHDAHLFTGTLGSNIDWGTTASARPGDVEASLAASAADEVVALYPAGLDHPVTERGASLSGGQRQRLALARALIAAPDVLVLHDPTTAVDAVTEQAIADGIRAVRGRAAKTTVVITSSPALLATADRVLLLVDGAIAAVGSHSELARGRDDYRELVSR